MQPCFGCPLRPMRINILGDSPLGQVLHPFDEDRRSTWRVVMAPPGRVELDVVPIHPLAQWIERT